MLCARMTTNMAVAVPSSLVASARSSAGSASDGSPRGTVPTTATP